MARRPVHLATTLAVLALPAWGAILPEQWGGAVRGAVSRPALTDRAVWDEYGLAESEQAAYTPEAGSAGPDAYVAGKPFSLEAYRLQDVTSALAAFQWQVPPEAVFPDPDKMLAKLGTEGLWAAYGNYLLRVRGVQPTMPELMTLVGVLPRLEDGPLPVLPAYLPPGGLAPGTRRYLIGPDSLAAFEPRITPSLAAFHSGAEGQLAMYRFPNGEFRLAVFNYPTPAIAKERLIEFEKLGEGAMVKRSGTLLAVALAPPDRDEAERLLARIRFQGQITWSERMPTRRDNIGDLILNAFVLIAILLGFCLVAGLAVGGLRTWLRLGRKGAEEEAMITLHLSDR